jgi:RNA polymerase sigma factor (TIGR02999 family)
MTDIENITKIINSDALREGKKVDWLFDKLYPEVKKIANAQLRRLGRSSEMSATMLVNECFIKLKNIGEIDLKNRKHFYSLTSRCMRFYLVDLFRQQQSKKNSGIQTVLTTEGVADDDMFQIDVLALDRALTALEKIDQQLAQVVELKFFGGFSFDEIGEIMSSTKGQVYQKWLFAKSILMSLIEDDRNH